MVEVHDPLPSVPAELGKPTHELTWRNVAILNTRRKPCAYKFPWAAWLSLFPTTNPPVETSPDDLPAADDKQGVSLEDEDGDSSPKGKLYSESWLLDGPFESLTEVVVAEKNIELIRVTRTESERSHTSYVYGWISEDGEEQDESGPDAGIPPAFIAEDSPWRRRHSCVVPETTPMRRWRNICVSCDGGRYPGPVGWRTND